MPLFRYRVNDPQGRELTGAMSARDDAEVRARLGARGYTVVQILGPETPEPKVSGRRQPRLVEPSPAERALFFRQFAALVRAGISPFSAVEDLANRTAQPGLRAAAAAMREETRTGGSISSAMERFPALFPEHVIAAVRAGETGGFIEIALDEIGLEYEQEIAFYKGIWLPRALVLQALLALALAQPMFPTLFPDNQPLRYLQLALLRNIPITLALLWGVRALWRSRFRHGRGRWRDRWTLRTPVFGELDRQRSLCAFIRMLRRLYAAGLSPIRAWEGASNVVPNGLLRSRLAEARDQIERGVPLHDAFQSVGLFTNEAEQLLATGVLAGQVVEMLDRIAEFYQANVQRAVDSARFWMYRLAITLFLIIGGATAILITRTYFDAIFRFTENWS